jgi:hypothetical protein
MLLVAVCVLGWLRHARSVSLAFNGNVHELAAKPETKPGCRPGTPGKTGRAGAGGLSDFTAACAIDGY